MKNDSDEGFSFLECGSIDLPLKGVRVIDITLGPLAAISRQFAELGASVLRIEPVGGTSDRRAEPLVAGTSIAFAAANMGKAAISLDLTSSSDRLRFDELLEAADILIENLPSGSCEAHALDVATLHRRYPALVVLSASDFGRKGPFCQWHGTDPVFHAISGELARSGIPGRAPLLPPGTLSYGCAVPQAVFVILVAYLNRLRTGVGDWLDFAVMDAAAQALDPGYGITGSATGGAPASQLPHGRPEARHQYPIIACADGYVRLCLLSQRQWRNMFSWMGEPQEFADPSFDLLQNRYASPRLLPAIAEFFTGKTRAELESAGQRYGVPIAAVLSLDEALASPHISARRLFRPVELAPGITAVLPDGMMEIDGRRAGIAGPPPTLARTYAWPPRVHGQKHEAWKNYGARPLLGLRVLDLGVIVVGAETSRLLADQGAEVIKIENSQFPDGIRNFAHDCKMSVSFASGHRNKQSLGLNLRSPEGKALLAQLVEQSDIVLSNFKPGTLDSLGLGYETLSSINPRIIMVDSSAFGAWGPWSRRLGYGPLVRASTGLTTQWCYPGEPGTFSDAITVYPDHVAGRIGALGALALVIRRLRTGRGGTVSVAQSEVMLGHMATQIAAGELAREGRQIEGYAGHDAPWGVFRCAGEDEWCVVTSRGDSDWQALCALIHRPDLAADPALASPAARNAQRDRIDAALSGWLSQRDPKVAMAALQAAGIPAGAMLRVSEVPVFAYFKERTFFREVRHPLIPEPFLLENAPVLSERLPDPLQDPAPLIGEQTFALARRLLGLPDEEIAGLIERGVLEAPLQHAPSPQASAATSSTESEKETRHV